MTTTDETTRYKVPNAYVLARMADCATPDTFESIGARFLTAIADGVLEALGYDDDRDDIPWDVADRCVPIYTYDMWRVFVELGAYNEDPTELGADGSDMGRAAMTCLYIIGERLAHAVLDDIGEREEE